jgi:HlyD family secretion protein
MNVIAKRGLGLLLAAAVALMIFYWMRVDPLPIETAVVTRGPLRVTIRDEGVTRIRERYEVSSPLTGRLQRITLDVGDPVVADETVLARVEPNLPSLLDPREVATAEARVRAAGRRSEVARLRLQTARTEAEHAEAERVRLYQLSLQDAVSDIETDQAELASRLKSDARRAAEYAVEIAQYELELEKAALLFTQTKGADSGKAEELVIRAPITGRVLRLLHENSGVIPIGTVLMEVGDPTDLELIVDVLSRDAVRVRPGAEVAIVAWGGDQSLRGRVRYVEPSGFMKVSALGVEEQRVNVIIDIEDPIEKRQTLGDQFRIEAEITVWKGDAVLQVPTAAIFRGEQGWRCYVVRDGIAELRELEIGQINESAAEVLKGLDENDRVIIYPGDRIAPGKRVKW